VGFEQAAIKVEKVEEYAALSDGIARIFADRVVELLQRLDRKRIRIRDFDLLLASGVLEQLDQGFTKTSARKLYESLTLSDQAQMREFYLSKVEEVDQGLREKFQKLYRYY